MPLRSNLRVARDLDRTNDNFLERTVPELRGKEIGWPGPG